jgi:hypothetical protein
MLNGCIPRFCNCYGNAKYAVYIFFNSRLDDCKIPEVVAVSFALISDINSEYF